VDYCGQTVAIVNRDTGGIREAQVFSGVLGASNYTYAEATWSQTLADWLGSHVRMVAYFGSCMELIVPDNLKSGISHACRYDPDINASYQQIAAHYGVAVMPARPVKPRDKAKVETAVQVVERWILARLRHHTFFSLAELIQCLRALLVGLNDKPFKQLPGNRRQAFEAPDKPALRPLPTQPYRYVAIKTVKLNVDYEQHYYSVLHHYVGEHLELHAGERVITAYFRGSQIATHARRYTPGMIAVAAHMPERHRQHHQRTTSPDPAPTSRP